MTKISARNVYFVHVLLVAIEKYNFRSLFLLFEVISFEELIITNVSFRFSLLPSFSSFVCGWFCFGSCLFIAFCFARPDSPCWEGKGSLAREQLQQMLDLQLQPQPPAYPPPPLYQSYLSEEEMVHWVQQSGQALATLYSLYGIFSR